MDIGGNCLLRRALGSGIDGQLNVIAVFRLLPFNLSGQASQTVFLHQAVAMPAADVRGQPVFHAFFDTVFTDHIVHSVAKRFQIGLVIIAL